MPSLATRTLYSLSQAARVGFFMANRYASNRISGPIVNWGEEKGNIPSLGSIMDDMRALFARDWAHIEAGTYPLPDDMIMRPSRVVRGALRYFLDLPSIHARRKNARHQDVFERAEQEGWLEKFPRYYLQNFHYQSDGWMTPASAKRYDYQVEVVFLGAADAMRRQALPPMVAHLRSRQDDALAIADIGCGTGRFLKTLSRRFPKAAITGVDLSPAYVKEATHRLRRYSRISVMEGALEDLPLVDDSQDMVSCLFTFHELPPKIRRATAKNIARILKPGGLYVHVDSVQKGDHAPYDDLLDVFPKGFHEPYYDSYVREDLKTLFNQHGLDHISETRAFFSKVSVFQKI